MGEIVQHKDFRIKVDGTIVRSHKCPNCGKDSYSENGFCEHCGARLKKRSTSGMLWGICIALIIIVAVVILFARKGKMSERIELPPTPDTIPYTIRLQYTSDVGKGEIVPYGYVDLGLPSGTLWKSQNEDGWYVSDNAVRKFAHSLPTKKQWDELGRYCEWMWGDYGGFSGYWVSGPNNRAIFLPAECLPIEGWVPDDVQKEDLAGLECIGNYISSDVDSEYYRAPWSLYFDDSIINGSFDYLEFFGGWYSVRLVMNKGHRVKGGRMQPHKDGVGRPSMPSVSGTEPNDNMPNDEDFERNSSMVVNKTARPRVPVRQDSKQGFDIIAGFYINYQTAEDLAFKLRDSIGCDAYIIDINKLYYISLGSAPSRTAAEKLHAHLSELYDGDMAIKRW